MKAWIVKEAGNLASLEMVERDIPKPSDGQIRVRVGAIGLNSADLQMIDGHHPRQPQFPYMPGMEVAGTVVDQHDDAFGVFPGDHVMAWLPYGGLAEEVIVDSGCCWVAPRSLSMVETAAYLMSYGTAHLALNRRARLADDETLLVLGAGGAMGAAAVALGRIKGVQIVAAAGGAEKCELARTMGADHVIDVNTEDLADRMAALNIKADVVFDPVGGDLFRQALSTISHEGRIISLGYAGGEIQEMHADELLWRNIDLIGFELGGYLPGHWEAVRQGFSSLAHAISDGRMTPYVGHVFPFEKAMEAYKLLAERRRVGKVVLHIHD
ncbi:NADPH:quinone oxidoreductase family protein [Aestuariispira insulae]|uniref:NADPH:quinone reductase-like Zn-dependent oxidoreductase n=1 Tax=Aestuariispira insulae TaxID=1461337 RepID=A0A3D9HI48_9PROT|nr:NADPH:quinone oxidoreductase family protein [Aestuariispira insulae]RED49123.1 NADPH:quinone reductase-like Zn-dependent oxidoreductase [Aestuariispira insulae]